jgi:hypothetical protein
MTEPITVDEIRALYPEPSTKDDGAYNNCTEYCVMGAACMTIAKKRQVEEYVHKFPGMATAMHWLDKLRPGLHVGQRLRYQEFIAEIFQYNDEGEFDKAWDTLDKLLKEVQGEVATS